MKFRQHQNHLLITKHRQMQKLQVSFRKQMAWQFLQKGIVLVDLAPDDLRVFEF